MAASSSTFYKNVILTISYTWKIYYHTNFQDSTLSGTSGAPTTGYHVGITNDRKLKSTNVG